jgi:hypothetical protein
MSGEEYLRTEEYLRAAKADPVCKERLRRLDAQSEAELRRFILVLAEINFRCQACENDQFEVVPGGFGAVGIGARYTSCGALHKARKGGSGA